MTEVEGILQRVKVFGLEKPSIRESGDKRINFDSVPNSCLDCVHEFD